MKKEKISKSKSLDLLLADHEKREPISARVKESTKQFFDKEADKRNVSASSIIAAVLDDYAISFNK